MENLASTTSAQSTSGSDSLRLVVLGVYPREAWGSCFRDDPVFQGPADRLRTAFFLDPRFFAVKKGRVSQHSPPREFEA